MSWLTDLEYAMNKKDYFMYMMLGFILYWVLSHMFKMDNLIILVPTVFIIWILLNRKIDKSFASMQEQNEKLISINIDEYPNLTKDIEVVNILLEVKDLVIVNRLKFMDVIRRTDLFFYLYDFVFTVPVNKKHFYDLAIDESRGALNALISFEVDLDSLPKVEFNGIVNVTDDKLKDVIERLKMRFQLFINKMEVKINEQWLKGDININTSPVYPDEVEPFMINDTQYSEHYNLY
jgi:hypothetical protein